MKIYQVTIKKKIGSPKKLKICQPENEGKKKIGMKKWVKKKIQKYIKYVEYSKEKEKTKGKIKTRTT